MITTISLPQLKTMKTIITFLLSLTTLCNAISQTISIILPAEQWQEIRLGLEEGKRDAQLVMMLSEALQKAEEIKIKDDQIIDYLNFSNNNLSTLVKRYQHQVIDLKKLNKIGDAELRNEKKQRLALSVVVGSGFGNASENLQAFIGIGISYQLIKIRI